jgi:hypothetical protein
VFIAAKEIAATGSAACWPKPKSNGQILYKVDFRILRIAIQLDAARLKIAPPQDHRRYHDSGCCRQLASGFQL